MTTAKETEKMKIINDFEKLKKYEAMDAKDKFSMEGILLFDSMSKEAKSYLAQRLNHEQRYFLIGKIKMASLEAIKECRELTWKEKDEMDFVKKSLFSSVLKFGMTVAREMAGKYSLDSDAHADIQQSLALIFFEKLPMYDPTRTAPITFFVRYFREAISIYLRKNSQMLSQYDAHNVSAVRAAIRYYESKGLKWTEEMLSNRTGLSARVLKNTLQIAKNSKRASTDGIEEFLHAKGLTPEEECVDADSLKEILTRIEHLLTKPEKDLFFLKINLLGNKTLTYAEVASRSGLTVRDVKQIFSGVIAKLSGDESIRMRAREEQIPFDDAPLTMQDTAASDCEEDFLQAMGGIMQR